MKPSSSNVRPILMTMQLAASLLLLCRISSVLALTSRQGYKCGRYRDFGGSSITRFGSKRLTPIPGRPLQRAFRLPTVIDKLSSPRSNQSSLPAVVADDGGSNLPVAVPVLLVVAIGLAVAAQGWINTLLQGKRGLGNYLQDGGGFGKSGFAPLNKDGDRAVSNDPLPWLRLPKLDFVEVAGQNNNDAKTMDDLYRQLEQMRDDMNAKYEAGKTEEANAVKRRLENLLRDNGMEYVPSKDGTARDSWQ